MSCSGRTHPASHGVFQEPISLVIAEIEATREMECMQRAKIETSGAQELYIHQQPQRLWHLGCFVQLRGVKDAAPNSRALEAKLANLVWPVVLVSNVSRSFKASRIKDGCHGREGIAHYPGLSGPRCPITFWDSNFKSCLVQENSSSATLGHQSVFFPLSGGFPELGSRAAGTHSEQDEPTNPNTLRLPLSRASVNESCQRLWLTPVIDKSR